VASFDGEPSKPWAAPGYKGALVSTLPEQQQQLVFAGINAAVLLGTAGVCTVVGPFFHDNVPFLFNLSRATWPLIGVTYVAAGVAHFTLEEDFINMMPHRGAWGFWELPGTPRFHVLWTGVAEILGGAGLLLGALPFTPDWLEPASAWGLLLLSAAVYPANIYMYTHNAQGPGPPVEEGEEPPLLTPPQHAARAGLQVLLMSVLWACAHR